MKNIICGIEYSFCPHCGSEDGDERIVHVFETVKWDQWLLCGLENTYIEEEEYTVKGFKQDKNACPKCLIELEKLISAQVAGFNDPESHEKQIALDKRRYAHWVLHGSLIGFDLCAIDRVAIEPLGG